MSLSKVQTKYWANKDLRTIQSYWESPPATKRSLWFAEQLKQFKFDSIFEIGFLSGRNLRYIREAFPTKKISGIEVNGLAVNFAKDKLGPDVILDQLDLHNLDTMKGSHDIVFTSGVLIHVPPENLKSAVEQIVRKANKFIMHLEQLGANDLAAGPKHLKPSYKVSDQLQWNPDLLDIYKSMGYNPKIISLPDDCKTNGAKELIIMEL